MVLSYDRSESSGIVITCSECSYWHSFRFSMEDAYRSGEDHAIRVHQRPPEKAAAARHEWERRQRHRYDEGATRR